MVKSFSHWFDTTRRDWRGRAWRSGGMASGFLYTSQWIERIMRIMQAQIQGVMDLGDSYSAVHPMDFLNSGREWIGMTNTGMNQKSLVRWLADSVVKHHDASNKGIAWLLNVQRIWMPLNVQWKRWCPPRFDSSRFHSVWNLHSILIPILPLVSISPHSSETISFHN